MKKVLFLVLFASLNGMAQKVEVLLIGTAHNYAKSPKQDLETINDRIRRFKPQAFFGEFLSKEDERLLADYWCKQDNLKRLATLKRSRYIGPGALTQTLDDLKQSVAKNPSNYRLKADLAHAFYLNQDVANGHYQFWQVFDHLNKNPDPELEQYVTALLSPELDTSGRSMKRLKTSEYALIAFPLLLEMGMPELLPMDCQEYDLNWTAAATAFHAKFEVFKKDTTATSFGSLQKMLEKRDNGFALYARNEKSSPTFTQWLNTDEASAILASGDFFFREMYDLKGFPKDEMLAQLHWWQKRNEGMCFNVVEQARATKAKRVVVIVGANHRAFMSAIFAKMKDVSVSGI